MARKSATAVHETRVPLRLVAASLIAVFQPEVAQAQASSGGPIAAGNAAVSDDGATLASAGIQDIIVTARRRDEQLQKVPVAITAFSGADLVTRAVTQPTQLQSQVPGLFTSPGSTRGSSSPVFSIRGQLNRDASATQDPSVGFYFAEVPWARIQGTNAAFFDLQSVQVLKGPQGTLFGRNSTGGAILVTPAAPTDEVQGYVKGSLGNYGLFSTEGVLNLPLTDTIQARIAAMHQHRDGYLRIVSSGQDTDDLNDTSVRASIKWTPSSSFTSTVIGSFYDSDTNGDGSRLIRVAPRAPSAGVAAIYLRFADALQRAKLLGDYETFSDFTPAAAGVMINGASQSLGTALYAKTRTYTIQDKSELSLGYVGFLGDLRLKNIVSYRSVKDRSTSEVVAVDFLSNVILNDQHTQQITEELQIQGAAPDFNYVIGGFYFREYGHDSNRGFSIAPVFSLIDNWIVNTSYSAFAHGDYDLHALIDGLNLTAGVRFNNDRRYWDGKNRRQTTLGVSANPLYTCLLQPTLPANDGSLCDFPNTKTFRVPTWDVGLNYRPAVGSLLYASVARGYRSGGFSSSVTSLAAAAPFGPEKVLNYELGSKNDFTVDGVQARVNLATFYSDYTDIQRTLNALLNGSLFNRTINAARAHIFGVEAEATLKPSRALEFTLSYSYLLPKYDKFTDIYSETNPAFVPAGQTSVLYPVDVSGSQFILVSRHSFNIAGSYTLPLPRDIGEVTIGANYYYRTSFLTTNDINTPNCAVSSDPNPAAFYTNCFNNAGRLPGYGLLNLRVDWRNMFGKSIDGAAFVNNVTDKYYFPNALNALATFGTLSAQVGPPRMFGVSLTYRFGR